MYTFVCQPDQIREGKSEFCTVYPGRVLKYFSVDALKDFENWSSNNRSQYDPSRDHKCNAMSPKGSTTTETHIKARIDSELLLLYYYNHIFMI